MGKEKTVGVYLFAISMVSHENDDISFKVDFSANEKLLEEIRDEHGVEVIQIIKREAAEVLRQFLRKFLRRKGIK